MTGQSPTHAGPGLTALLQDGITRAPERVGFRSGGAEHTYDELHRRSLRLAAALPGPAEGPQRRVGILTGSSVSTHVGLLAVWYAGCTAVPLNTSFPAQRTAAMLRAAQVGTVIVDDAGAAALRGIEFADLTLEVVDERTIASSGLRSPVTAGASDIAYIMFTSGSTGRPKGVPVTQANVLHFLRCVRDRFRLDSDDVLAQTFDPTFDLFMVGPLLAWSHGATLVSVPVAALTKLPAFASDQGLTFWFSVPSTIKLLRQAGVLRPGALPQLTRSLFCGEALTVADAAAWSEAAPHSEVHNLYGPTELTIACTSHRWSNEDAAHAVHGVVPIGSMHEGLRYLVIDETMRVTDGRGELCVTGPQMVPGYLDPADDAGRFIELAGERWYRTGDRVEHLAGGGLAYLGRTDHQVKIRGYRVELPEIEHALRTRPGIVDGVAVIVAGSRGEEIVAVCTGTGRDQRELRRELSLGLPGYMVPSRIVWADVLPHSANGKVDRAAAAELAGSPLRQSEDQHGF